MAEPRPCPPVIVYGCCGAVEWYISKEYYKLVNILALAGGILEI